MNQPKTSKPEKISEARNKDKVITETSKPEKIPEIRNTDKVITETNKPEKTSETENKTITENRLKNVNETFAEHAAVRKIKLPNPVMKEHAPYFLGMAFLYSICFVIAFYRNFIGITFPLITTVTLIVCGLFLKKSQIPWKKSNWCYAGGSILLGISTFLTTNEFVIFFNTVGILLLITVLMLRQVYNDKEWNFGQYLCNILFLYLSMIPEAASPFIHFGNQMKRYKKDEKKNKNIKYILIGILIGCPMLLILIELLSSADQIFSRVVGTTFHHLWNQIVFSPNVFIVLLLFILGFFGIYCFLSALTLNNMPEWKQRKDKKNPLTAITFLSMITVIYLIFCGIQMIFLFTGGKLLPEGYTYAEYAHQGFFQLLFVCMFNLVLVVSCIAIFQINKFLRALLLVFSGCTYIMIASSAYRMLLYIHTYHLSFLRVLVLWFLAMLVVLMAGVIINIVKEKFHLFRYCMTVVTVCYLIFSFGRADYLIASYNVAQMGNSISYEDITYLTNLSMDAAPALSRYALEHENCKKGDAGAADSYEYNAASSYTEETYETENDYGEYYGDYYNIEGTARQNVYITGCKKCRLDWNFQKILDGTEDMNVRTFNFSKYIARKAAESYFDEK